MELLGTHPDGNQLILNDSEGSRYILAITEDLREAVKTPPVLPNPELKNMESPQASPKNIQMLIRQGKTAEEVAQHFNLDLKRVERYEGPILAEREYAAEKAQNCLIGNESDSPKLGDLVIDRLAARGVNPLSLKWDAIRHGKGPWEVILTFVQGATEQEAHWRLDNGGTSVFAIDEEAAWLSESKAPGNSDNFGTPAEVLHHHEREKNESIIVRDFRTDNILEELNSTRGLRHSQSSFTDDEDELSEFNAAIQGKEYIYEVDKNESLPKTHHATVIPLSRSTSTNKDSEFSPLPTSKATKDKENGVDLELEKPAEENPGITLPGLETIIPEKTEPVPKKTKRKTRQSIPTWDEIVFGTKPR